MQPRDPSEPAPHKKSRGPNKPTGKTARKSPDKAAGQTHTGLLGFGLDGEDGHKRVTKGSDFLLLGGSAETHERMQDLVVRMSEKLKGRGRRFADLSRREFEDLARDTLR